MMFGLVKKYTSGFVDMSIAITVGTGAQNPQTRYFRGPWTLKCTAWVDIPKHGIIGPF